MKKIDFYYRHRLIGFIRDINIKGSGFLSRALAKIIFPKPEGELIIKTIHNFDLIINPKIDKGVESSLYISGTYEKGILNLMEFILNRGDIFVDVGANIGLMSIHAAKIVGNEGVVYSFEANPDTEKILNKNRSLNGLSNLRIVQKALGSSNSSGKIYTNWHVNRGGASLIKPEHESNFYEVDVVRFDDFMKDKLNKDIRLLKIDIEGFELEALKGFGTILSGGNAPALIIECSATGNNSNTMELFRYIRNVNDYRVYKLKNGKERISKLLAIENKSQLPKHDNIICLLPNHLNSPNKLSGFF